MLLRPARILRSPSMAGTFWRAETGFFLGIWLIILLIGRDGFMRDPGTLWHPVVGQRIWATGQFIRTDPFSCTFQGQPWIAQQWLAECVMAGLDACGGLDSLLLALATLLAGLYTW